MNLGISGQKGNGKTTLANLLSDENTVHLTFAGKLKEIICDVFSITDTEDKHQILEVTEQKMKDMLNHKILEPYPEISGQKLPNFYGKKTLRQVLQFFGTDVCRNMRDDVWLDLLKNQMKPGKNHIVSDIRFENEFDYLKDLGFIMINKLGKKQEQPEHISEKPLQREFDFTYGWFDDLEELKNQAINDIY